MKEKGYSFMPMMKAPCNFCHLNPKNMHDEIESMYPQIYMIIYPHVKEHCHMMFMKHGHMHHHTKEDIENMCALIHKKCEKQLNEYFKDDHENEHEHDHDHSHDHNHRVSGYGRRDFAGDLVRILLLRELLGRRRRRPFFPHHGFRDYGYDYPSYGYRNDYYYDYDYDYVYDPNYEEEYNFEYEE